METKKLKNNVDVLARGVLPEDTHTATHIRVKQLDIVMSDIEEGSCTVTYELGTVVSNEFSPLAVEQPNNVGTYTIVSGTFDLLANTPIAPHERSMTPYNIIKTRLYNHMQAINIIEI